MPTPKVVSIHISPTPSQPTIAVERVNAIAGKGLEGDRYFNKTGTFSKDRDWPDQEVTLIESEALEALRRDYEIAIEPAQTRRNILTSGISLNHLVGREFSVGPVRLKGIRLCEPCGHLEKMTRDGVRKGLVHRGGLRAAIVVGGTIRVDDPVVAGD